MKTKLILLFGILFINCLVFGQKTIGYDYDVYGNRESRVIILDMVDDDLSLAEKNDSIIDNNIQENSESFGENYIDFVNNIEVKIFPNPTTGIVNLSIPNWENLTGELLIVDIKGNILFQEASIKANQQFDLSEQSNGLYILKIHINDQTSEWKIIKK